MCGIAGIVATTPRALAAQLQPMLDAQAHRGPDAWGVWPTAPETETRVAFGHRRLAIIDLSEAGRQPMANAAGNVWITFNGEIYNFQELRAELERLGYRFRTRSDTETILYAYEQWGTDCVKHLRGMFALGLWDEARQRLFLARDRVGKKPLFYAQVGERLLFASELQGLLADREVPRAVNLAALDSYLSYGYIPAPHTAYQGVFKLPPAHWLTVDIKPDGFRLQQARYWSLAYEPKQQLSEPEAREQIRAKLTEAVRLRMISDVPLGAFLSGGIDSSIVVGLMAQQSAQPVKTFSIGFDEAAYNETDHARRIAEKWQTTHHEFIVKPNALEILPKLVRHYGEPYADSSAVPTFYVSQLTRQHVTVALNGDGGDESFAGYERYLGNRVAEKLHAVPGAAFAGKLASRLLPDSIDPKNRMRTVRRFLTVAAQPMAERYTRWLSFFHGETKPQLYSPEFLRQLNGARDGYLASLFAEVYAQAAQLDPVDAAMAVDVQSYLPFDLLVKVDITTMANSLEARSPFLDHEVMELAARLPVQLKAPGKDLKHLLKTTFADLLPPANVNRRKMGFGVPLGTWFRGDLRDFVRDVLLSKAATERGYFQRAEVERLVTEHQAGRADYAFQLWSLLMLELWQQEFAPRT